MIRKIATAAAIAGAALTVSVSANAMDFPATPMNMGAPTNLPGETIIPGMRESMMVVNGVTQPILQPMLAPGGGAMAAAEPAPMMHHHHHHHHMMMHKKMMMKKM
jgi:hypothetical protein